MLKQFDRDSKEYQEVLRAEPKISALFLSHVSLCECKKILEKSGESLTPVDLLPFLKPVEQLHQLTNGFLNVHEKLCTPEEGLADIVAFVQRQVRQALTQALAIRKKQAA